MQVSKLTFSLASLVLIFALAFAAVPAMAADGGPAVTSIEKYSGKVLLDANNDGVAELGTANYVATRGDFRVKITFNNGVVRHNQFADRINAQGGNNDGLAGSPVGASSSLELPNKGGKEHVVSFNITANTATEIAVSISADAYTGDTLDNVLGSQPSTARLGLPALHPTVTASFGSPTATTGTAGNYTVTLTFDSGQTDSALDLDPDFSATYIEVAPENAATVTVGTEDNSTTGKLSYPLTIQLGYGVSRDNPATISVPDGYVKDGASIELPPAEPITQPDPVATITDPDPTHKAGARTFRLTVNFTRGAKSDGSDGDPVETQKWGESTGKTVVFDPERHLSIQDNSDGDALITVESERASDNRYIGILKYDAISAENLPITITFANTTDDSKDNYFKLEGDVPEVMFGEASIAPDAPTGLTASQTADAMTVDLSWTAPSGTVTSYTIMQTGAANATYSDITGTSHTTPALAAGNYSFTVTATNDHGTSDASNTATATVAAPTVHPSVAIEVSDVNVAARTFGIDVTLTGASPAITSFSVANLAATDKDSEAVSLTAEAERFNQTTQKYTAILKYDALAQLPLSVTTASDFMTTGTPTPGAVEAPSAPAAPTNVTAVADQATDMITISWDLSEGATSYAINQTGQAATTYSGIQSSPYTTGALAAGNYSFTVVARNAVGGSPPSAAATATIDADKPTVTRPGAPTGVTATADQDANTITIEWVEPTDTGGEAITGYTITQSGAADATHSAKASPFTTDALAAGDYSFTVSAMNSAGDGPESSPATATIDVDPPANNAPAFAADATIADITGRVGIAITSMTLPMATDADGDAITYSISPTPPAGLTFNAATRTLSGTPTAAMAMTQYTYMASDGTDSDSLTFNITVGMDSAPAFTSGATISSITATVGTAIAPVVLPTASDADGDAITYSISPALPAGLTFTAATRLLSGTPSAASAAAAYTYTATANEKTATLSFAIVVNAAPTAPPTPDNAPVFASGATISTITATAGTAIAPVVLPAASDADGDAITYSISPRLPTGLTFTAATRLLSGTPSVASAARAYTYTARAGGKSATLSFAIVVNAAPTVPDNAPVFASGASIDNITATAGTAITATVLPMASDADGDAITYSISPALPAGLTFTAATRLLSGTPTAASAAAVYAYTATAGGKSATLSFVIVVNAAPTPPPPAIILPPGIPDVGGGFVASESSHGRVVGTTTLNGSIAANSFGVVLADDLPDLEDFFRRKGTIVLNDGTSPAGENLGTRTVLISEILWGLDAGEPAASQDKRQFIELYNTSKTTGSSVDVTGWTLTFTLHRPAPPNVVDRVSNAGTIVDAGWFMDVGQSGVLTGTTLAGATALGGTGVPVDIISMYRNINYNAVQGGGDRLKADHVRWGHQKGSWKATTRITTQVGIKASPGARHFVELGPLTKTNVSRSPFIINEIGNATGGANDWIELRNVTDSVQSLKNYQLSVVTSDKKDTQLFHFHDKDYKVPAKGVILVTSTDPSGNDLAGGNDVAKGDLDEVLEGATHLYVVRSFNLPDSGKTLLILRNNHESKHLGTGNQIVDVIGTLSIQDSSRGTALWPLYVWGGPHGNVVKNGDEDFRAGKVYQRNNTNADGKEAIEIRGYTGIGYDRFAAVNGENGGTPGYDNGALKHKYSDYTGQIAISEIMLATEEDGEAGRLPRATRLPQWIELYNNSMTQAVTISGWKLEIQNDDTEGFEGNLHGTLSLKAIHIQPNQTVIIVSNSGLNSGNFPAQRLINVFLDGTYRRELGLVNRGDQMLNPAGFYIELRDHENRPVDEIGNLGVSRRTGTGRRDNFGEEWPLPSLHSEEGHRTSLIRVYNNNTAENGLMAESWRRASDTNFRNVPSLTYYGNHRDFGTPGYRGGGPLPVSLSKFRPERLDSGEVVIRWVTESELNNAGFNILRTESRDGQYVQVNTELIKGHGTTSERHTYEWKDTTAKPNVVYYYQIQDVSLDGQVQTLRVSRLKGNVSVEGKATTTWGSLKSQD